MITNPRPHNYFLDDLRALVIKYARANLKPTDIWTVEDIEIDLPYSGPPLHYCKAPACKYRSTRCYSEDHWKKCVNAVEEGQNKHGKDKNNNRTSSKKNQKAKRRFGKTRAKTKK